MNVIKVSEISSTYFHTILLKYFMIRYTLKNIFKICFVLCTTNEGFECFFMPQKVLGFEALTREGLESHLWLYNIL